MWSECNWSEINGNHGNSTTWMRERSRCSAWNIYKEFPFVSGPAQQGRCLDWLQGSSGPFARCHSLGQWLIRTWWHHPLKISPCPALWPCLELVISFFKNTFHFRKNLLSSCQPVSWVWLAWTNHPEHQWTHRTELLNPKIWRHWWSCQGASHELLPRLNYAKVHAAKEKHHENPCNN